MEQSKCQSTVTPNHSDDVRRVYCGRPEPVILCGYHRHPAWISESLASIPRKSA